MEAGAVKAVGLSGQQHGVQAVALQLCGNFLKVIHMVDSPHTGCSQCTSPLAKRQIFFPAGGQVFSTAAFTKP